MHRVYRFGEFEVDGRNFALSRNSVPVPVEPLALDLILDLLAHHGQLRTRDDLVDAIWDGRFVSDSTISTAVKTARKVLGDSGDQQRYIKTVRGRGFVFDSPLDKAPEVPPAVRPAQPGPMLGIHVQSYDDSWEKVQARAFAARLRSVLARVPMLRISATSPRDPEDLEALASAGLTLLVDLGVHATGSTTMMDVSVIDVRTGVQSWARSFQVPPGLVGAEVLLHQVVAPLEPAITRTMIDALSDGSTDPRAKVLEAVSVLATFGWNKDSFKEANRLLDDALSADPNIAIGHAYAALIRALAHRVGINRDEAELARAISHAEAALDLETQDSFVLGIAGCALCDAGQPARGGPILRRAVELNPANGHALTAIGASQMMERNIEEALKNLRAGIEISPADSRLAVWEALLALAELVNEDIPRAEEAARAATSRDDKNYISRLVLTAVMGVKDDQDGLMAACTELLRVHPELSEDEVRFMIGNRLKGLVWPAVQARRGVRDPG
jgi:DNA-binding winged helix-turn-helix (wHTH) protein/Tfp pilus assembly protein PilF